MKIPFRKLYTTEKELNNIQSVIRSGSLTGGKKFISKCESYFKEKYQFPSTIFTSSCTAALEIISFLIDIKKGDEIIMPSYTFVSTANAFVLRGAKIVFVDSNSENPNISVAEIEQKITSKTKAILVMHYAGTCIEIDEVATLAKKYQLFLIEDAAMAIHSFYKEKPLGSYGDFATFSFHETKNITSGGEGGMLVLNDTSFLAKAFSIKDKGTNRQDFQKGKVDKYQWVSQGSAYSLTELQAAFLSAQLEKSEEIQRKLLASWSFYYDNLKDFAQKGFFKLPKIIAENKHNGSAFYLVFNSSEAKEKVIVSLKEKGIQTAFHYQALHKSPFYLKENAYQNLPNAEKYSDCLLRLPLFYEITEKELQFVVTALKSVFEV